MVRVACAGMVAGAVLAVTCQPQRAVTADQDQRTCAYLDAIMATAFMGVSPPPDATPADFDATLRVNAQLSQLREQLRGSDLMRESGCAR